MNNEKYRLRLRKELERIEYEIKTLEAAKDTLGEFFCADEYPAHPDIIPIEDDYELMQKRINAALLRIDNGSYRVCLMCGEQINPLRLAALPESEYCRDCAEKCETDE